MHEEVVNDDLTGLTWLRNANVAEFPHTWAEALDIVDDSHRRVRGGYEDWRLPSCRELRSLVSYQTRRPALPANHPFERVYPSWYWTGTTAAVHQAYAWYVNMDGGRMFYGHKQQSFMVWPVRGGLGRDGLLLPTPSRVGDVDVILGLPPPEPRFVVLDDGVEDRLTRLVWYPNPNLLGAPCSWQSALDLAATLDRDRALGARGWRLPSINELDSLVDFGRAFPALPPGHPFGEVPEAVWASTTSSYEPDWAWALYLHKGACGVGQKALPHYHAWMVRDVA